MDGVLRDDRRTIGPPRDRPDILRRYSAWQGLEATPSGQKSSWGTNPGTSSETGMILPLLTRQNRVGRGHRPDDYESAHGTPDDWTDRWKGPSTWPFVFGPSRSLLVLVGPRSDQRATSPTRLRRHSLLLPNYPVPVSRQLCAPAAEISSRRLTRPPPESRPRAGEAGGTSGFSARRP
jgi:hypothetical protein